jgi:hypothetical protein
MKHRLAAILTVAVAGCWRMMVADERGTAIDDTLKE